MASTVLRPLIHKFLLLGYFLGLLTATVSSEFFKAAQPALLYLVPFTLFPLFLMAYLKGDLRSMWEVDFANNNYTKLPKCQVIWKQNPFHNSYRQIKDYFSIVVPLLKSSKSWELFLVGNGIIHNCNIILENNWIVSKDSANLNPCGMNPLENEYCKHLIWMYRRCLVGYLKKIHSIIQRKGGKNHIWTLKFCGKSEY